MNKLRTVRSELMPFIGMAFALGYWLIDSAIDTYILELHNHYTESLLNPGRIALWARLQVVFLLMAFSLIAMLLLRYQTHITGTVAAYKDELEIIVEERTRDLEKKNQELEFEIREKQKAHARLKHLATVDPLTAIYNRRVFNEVMSYELRRDERYTSKMSLIICDVDHFKQINDTYGHIAGDSILKIFADIIRSNVRKADTFARWGGEEFVILLPETGFETAVEIAEKIRIVIQDFDFPYVGNITASFGVTQHINGDTEENMFSRADEALLRAKKAGRNKTEIEPQLHVLLNALSGA